ncbi:M23/M56 family metallopeptidase [Solimicrobium silvestre]|uniref:BlaR1 peptidase M56 n=1 Tax=Solimicrobium silvestre TaxID=2099400 RepID=A0A2S9H0V6_9BURK|nr:M23/M56 family metallopeptidase [Solimicrobium silvestre]PRC93597.1 BlaR1 peptidase M56 [Solimicrobium silvestre]
MNEIITNFSLLFLQASISCTVVALIVWGVLALAVRIWPGLSIQRSVWLLAQVAIGVAFLLVWVPQTAHLSILPTFTIAATSKHDMPTHIDMARPIVEQTKLTDPASDEEVGTFNVTHLAWIWLAVYSAGLALNLTRWLLAKRKLQALLTTSEVLTGEALRTHPALNELPEYALNRVQIMETSAAVSPMLVGVGLNKTTRLLLPQHLRSFNTEQQRLIVAHELTHWRRHDLLFLHLSTLLQTLFWFNPILRSLGKRLNWAQELGCDQQVLTGRSQQQRQHYAAALVGQLKAQQALFDTALPALAFGAMQGATLATRINLIRRNTLPNSNWLSKYTVAAGLAGVLICSMLLQPAFALHDESVDLSTSVVTNQNAHATESTATLPQWSNPVSDVHINAFYGVQGKLTPNGHHGIDFSAKLGTPVLAMADGTVIASTEQWENDPHYGRGRVVVIQHPDNLRSLYAHLGSSTVKVGDVIKAGQVIAYSGASGKVTGPHLHVEAWQGEQLIDPQRLLAGLDEHASQSALRARNAIKMN